MAHLTYMEAKPKIKGWREGQVGSLACRLPREDLVVLAPQDIRTRRYCVNRVTRLGCLASESEVCSQPGSLPDLVPSWCEGLATLTLRTYMCVHQVACGQDHSLFLTDRGEVYSCGWGADGQTGRCWSPSCGGAAVGAIRGRGIRDLDLGLTLHHSG